MDYEAIGRESGMFEQLGVKELLRSQNTTRPTGLFTGIIFPPVEGLVGVENKVVYASENWDNQFVITTTKDIEKFTAEIELGPERDIVFVNGPLYVAGDTVSYRDVAHAIQVHAETLYSEGNPE